MIITVDNIFSNDTTLQHFKNYLRETNKSIIGDGCLHVRCVAPILILSVTDGLKDLHDLVAMVRSVMRFVKSSPTRLDKFKVAMRAIGIECKKAIYFL